MSNETRIECADCEHVENCALEDYQCSMLEESQKEKFNGFVLKTLKDTNFKLTTGFKNKCFVAECVGIKISRTEEDCTVGYKVEFNLDPCGCMFWDAVEFKTAMMVGFDIIEEISHFEGTLDI